MSPSTRRPSTRQPSTRRPARPPMPVPAGAQEVFTDGACAGNPGPGGWAWAIDEATYGTGRESPSTNQRMEVKAAFEAVLALPGPLLVVSDSTYVVHCFRDAWWRGWRSRGWTNSARQPVANRDLWEPFIDAVEARGDVAFRWVKGHSGNAMNDLVDRLAVAAAKETGPPASSMPSPQESAPPPDDQLW